MFLVSKDSEKNSLWKLSGFVGPVPFPQENKTLNLNHINEKQH